MSAGNAALAPRRQPLAAVGIIVPTGCQQPAGCFDEVPGPDEMIATQVIISSGETPGDGKTGNDTAQKTFGLVGAHHCRADAIQVTDILLLELVKIAQQAGKRTVPRLSRTG